MMQLILFFIALLLLGFTLFCFVAGMVMFGAVCKRSIYTKKSPVDGGDHVKDSRIMNPLLAAKERWKEKPIEKLTLTAQRAGLFKRFYSKKRSTIQLAGDLWLHSALERSKKIAILVHGFSDSATGMAYLAEAYYEKGISVLAVNLRAHGDSDGRFAGLGCIKTDGADVAGWAAYLMRRFGQDTQIILHGVSMGAATVIQSAFGLHVPVVLVVADCGFSDFSNQMQRHLKLLFPRGILQTVIAKGVGSFASLINFLVNGFFFSQNSPKNILLQAAQNNVKTSDEKKQSVPLLIFHGSADTMAAPSSAEELFAAASEPKELVLIKDAPHIGSWFYEKKEYMKEVFKYLPDC